MILSRKSLDRRTFLRGMGATISLPLLDAMVPAATASTLTAANPVRRLGYVFIPMGSDITRWTPRSKDDLNQLSPILEPLAGVKEQLTVLSNLELQPAYPGTHATSNAAFLSAARAKRTESSDYFLGVTADQIAAKQIGQGTQLPSLELAMDLMETVGQCDNGYACVYQNNLSWSSPTTPLPAEAHPRLVFESLFGEGGTHRERINSLKRRASLLDAVRDDLASLKRTLGAGDRAKMDEYLEAVRDVERRIQLAESTAKDAPRDMERPVGVPAEYAEHARLMFDLQLLAFRGDITRVSTFQLARETSNRTYPETGVTDPHHPLSHHGNDPEKIERMSRINRYHVSLFAEFLEKLRDTPEGEGNLLDHSLILYGSGMGNPNLHDHTNLPVLVAGGAAGGMKGNRHLRYDEPTPLANLHLSLLDKVGVDLEKFGDSTGPIEALFL
ncbi:DUF1552 domain-containing protein [Haloferula rosea]|uniref:DUF1552 domain-containing protein n=1 Tax=Haloferula rosea TaxID=490093 RepID=A0A934RCD1_9BACT|nr:DUF1552 domain-containing protein [Haloferula rosea]MBK1826026.1 DUF1552 domain-containing protein [Haloferula rosea]